MISVIVPVYNCELYIDQCIESIINQDYNEFELIIINDGSTDHTSEICERWRAKESRITLLHQENQGQGSARNAGVLKAKGDYLLFVDADDFLEPQALSYLYGSTCSGEHDIIMFSHYYINDELNEKIEFRICMNLFNKADILLDATTFLWDKMFRRAFFVQNIALDNHYGEDLSACAYLVALTDKIEIIDRALYTHRDRVGNLTSDPRKVQEITDSLYRMVEHFRINHLLQENYNILLYLSYKQFRLYFIDLAYRFSSNEYIALLNRFDDYFNTVFPEEVNILETVYAEHIRRYVTIGCGSITALGQWRYWGSLRNIEYYMIDPYLIRKENETQLMMTDYFIDFSMEFDAIKYETVDLELWKERWQRQCRSFIAVLRESPYTGNIILIRRKQAVSRLNEVMDWCIDTFSGMYEAVICDDIRNRADFLKVVAIKGFSHYNFQGEEKVGAIDEAEKYLRGEFFRANINLNILNMLLKIKESDRKLSEFFHEHAITNVTIYGMGYLGERLAEILHSEGFEIRYGIDRKVKGHPFVKLIEPEDSFDDTEAIVITPVHLFQEIKPMLENKVSCSIISLEEIIDYFVNK